MPDHPRSLSGRGARHRASASSNRPAAHGGHHECAALRLRDAVLANISHEFRTPLSAQLASIELLLDQLPELTTDQIGALVVSLQRGTLRLTQLIDNLLESVRIEAGQHTLRRRPVSVDEVVEQALEL